MNDSVDRSVTQSIDSAAPTSGVDRVAVEEPLEIRVRGRAISVTMRTPGNDDELSLGFLISEGVIRSIDDVVSIDACDRNEEGNLVNVVLRPEVHVDFERLTRHVFASSSCGLCGRTTIESLRNLFKPIDEPLAPSRRVLLELPQKMRAAQRLFDETGGVHAAALFTVEGELIAVREDVGRHNAVDKIVGHAAAQHLLPLNSHILVVSGRASFEIVQKALAARIGVVAAVSAPTSLAVDFAAANHQILVGFLRDRRMNCYTGSLDTERGG